MLMRIVQKLYKRIHEYFKNIMRKNNEKLIKIQKLHKVMYKNLLKINLG